MGSHIIIKSIVIGPLNCAEENSILKILIFRGGGRGLAALQTYWPLKYGARTFNFRSIVPPDILEPLVRYDGPYRGKHPKNK